MVNNILATEVLQQASTFQYPTYWQQWSLSYLLASKWPDPPIPSSGSIPKASFVFISLYLGSPLSRPETTRIWVELVSSERDPIKTLVGEWESGDSKGKKNTEQVATVCSWRLISLKVLWRQYNICSEVFQLRSKNYVVVFHQSSNVSGWGSLSGALTLHHSGLL